jgi:hypothetical protein
MIYIKRLINVQYKSQYTKCKYQHDCGAYNHKIKLKLTESISPIQE